MNQPKFKIGDSLKTNGGKVFLVKGVSEWKDRPVMYYESEVTVGYREDQLELYQEPQKKKLYAYRVIGKLPEIKMFMNELLEEHASVNRFIRDTEYDIEYPEETV